MRPSPAHQLHAQIALLELTVAAIMVDLPNLWLVLNLKNFSLLTDMQLHFSLVRRLAVPVHSVNLYRGRPVFKEFLLITFTVRKKLHGNRYS